MAAPEADELPGIRIDDPVTCVGLAVVGVFGMEGVATGFQGGGGDGGVPKSNGLLIGAGVKSRNKKPATQRFYYRIFNHPIAAKERRELRE